MELHVPVLKEIQHVPGPSAVLDGRTLLATRSRIMVNNTIDITHSDSHTVPL